jgi:hypothetical protein
MYAGKAVALVNNVVPVSGLVRSLAEAPMLCLRLPS